MHIRLLVATLALTVAIPSAAAPADPPDTEASAAEEDEGKGKLRLFPPFRKKAAAEEAEEDRDGEASADEPVDEVAEEVPRGAVEEEEVAAPPAPTRAVIRIDPDAPAADVPAEDRPPEEGIWTWVDRLEGEIPSPEQVAALKEAEELMAEERDLTDSLAGAAAPKDFYTDPAKALETDPLFLDMVDPAEFDIPIEVNPWVEKWVQYFTGPGRKYYHRWLTRSSRYRPMMLRELDEAGLPQDLVYLSMIESGYNAHAYSHAAAAGLWQFIPSTGKLYDLRIDWWVDERRDPEKSLGAAIAFLSELHQMFGDWRLAWAAYNGGPGRVRRATSRAGSKDFWDLANGPYLHPETDNYVPKIMAAAIIGKHPERYGFTDIDYQSELVYDTVHVDGSVELEVIAKCAGVSVDDLKWLNPALRRYATPPEGADVRIPVGKEATFVAALAEVPKDQRLTVVRHTVRRGETLSTIAGRYGTSVSAVSRANGLRNVNRIYVGMTLVIPRHGSAPVAVASNSSSSSSSSSSKSSSSSRPSVHTVRRGDTLSGIAGRYGLTVSQLKAYNGLSSSTIQTGQKLKLSGTGGTSSGGTVTHVVQRGETLSAIASRYGTTSSAVQRTNGIRNASHIVVGQRLKVSPGSGSTGWETYTVRSGDSLGKIASRYGCSVKELQSWNGIRGSTIHPGQKIKVRRG